MSIIRVYKISGITVFHLKSSNSVESKRQVLKIDSPERNGKGRNYNKKWGKGVNHIVIENIFAFLSTNKII